MGLNQSRHHGTFLAELTIPCRADTLVRSKLLFLVAFVSTTKDGPLSSSSRMARFAYVATGKEELPHFNQQGVGAG